MAREKPIQVIPTAEDEEFTIWLGARFSGGDEYATRIQVCQWINNQRGDVVSTYDTKPDAATDGKAKGKGRQRLTREKLVELSHKLRAAAQADCDALRRSTVYSVLAFNPLMGSDAYSRCLLRCTPKSALAVDVGAVVNEDSIMSTRLLVGLLANSEKNARWAQELAHNTMNEHAERDAVRIGELQKLIDDGVKRQAEFLAAQADRRVEEKKVDIEAADHAETRADQKAQREKTHATANILRHVAMEAVTGLGKIFPQLISLLAGGADPQKQLASPAPSTPGSSNRATPLSPLPVVPPEVVILSRFVDAVRREKLDDALWGKDESTPGIFTIPQVKCIADVRTGIAPVEKLDDLLPDSGAPESIRPSQMAEAVSVLLPHPAILSDVSTFLALRTEARKKKGGAA